MKATILNWIRYLMLKIMKRFRREDDDRPTIAVAEYLLDKALPSAFETFRDPEFRELVKFETLKQVEQDRIFNELTVSAICICIYALDQNASVTKIEDFHFWQAVKEQLPGEFHKFLIGFGSDKKNAQLFRDLIKIRYNEYDKYLGEMWDWWQKNEPQFQKLSKAGKNILTRTHSVGFGTALHIKRGKIKPGDPLTQYLRYFLFILDKKIVKFIRNL